VAARPVEGSAFAGELLPAHPVCDAVDLLFRDPACAGTRGGLLFLGGCLDGLSEVVRGDYFSFACLKEK
jgi:hypothetical protein